MLTMEEYGVKKEELEGWYQNQISALQGEHGDSPEELDQTLNVLETEYQQRLQTLRDEYSIEEGYEVESQTLRDAYWKALEDMEKQKAAHVSTQMQELGLDHDMATTAARAEFEERGQSMEREYQERYDALRRKHELPPGEVLCPKSKEMSEGILDDWWVRLQELFARYVGEAETQAEHLLDDPNEAKRRVDNLERVLLKKEQNGAFATPMQEGIFSWTKYLNIPGFFWRRVYLRWMESRFGWLRDKSWAKRVRRIDPSADPDTFENPDPDSTVRTKEEYTGVFFAALTLSLIGVVASMAVIPVVAELIGYLFVEAKGMLLAFM